MSAKQYLNWLPGHNWNAGFAHYYIDRFTVVRTEDTYNAAWHTATVEGNTWYIGYEVVQSMSASDKDFLANEDATLKQAAEDLKYYGLPANRNTVRLHQEFSATSCPHRSWALHGQSINSVKDYFIARINAFMKGESPATPSIPKPPVIDNKFKGVNTAGAQFKLNDKVKMTSAASRYQTGQPISASAKSRTYTVYNTKAVKQSNSSFAYLIGIDNVATGWVLQQDIVGGKTSTPVKPANPAPTTGTWKRTPQNGTFIPNTLVAVKPEPTVNSKQIDTYSSGQRINYDSYIEVNGYVWVSYISYSGARRYVPWKESSGKKYGVCI